MLASKILRHPYNFDFSKNNEYRALRIAGGKKKKGIESAVMMDHSFPPSAAKGNSITANTIRAKLIVPTDASRNRNDNQLVPNPALYYQPRAGDAERSRRFLLLFAFFRALSRTKRIAE